MWDWENRNFGGLWINLSPGDKMEEIEEHVLRKRIGRRIAGLAGLAGLAFNYFPKNIQKPKTKNTKTKNTKTKSFAYITIASKPLTLKTPKPQKHLKI